MLPHVDRLIVVTGENAIGEAKRILDDAGLPEGMQRMRHPADPGPVRLRGSEAGRGALAFAGAL